MALDPDFLHKIKKKNYEEIEAAWTANTEAAAGGDLTWFLAVAKEMCATKSQPKALDLMLQLVESLAVMEAWEPAFEILGTAIKMAPRARDARAKAEEISRARYEHRPDLDEVLAVFNLDEAEDPVRAFTGLRDWLRFEPGATFWLFGRGLGKVAEVNLGLQKVKINFEKAAPLVVRADEAKRLVTYLAPEHFMVRRLEDKEAVTKEAKAEPGLFVRDLYRCFGRALTSAEIKECMVGVVEGGRWTSWWNKAKSHPQVLPSKYKRNTFEWSDSAESAEETLLSEFGSAGLTAKMELARKHAKRGGAVKAGMLEGLQDELDRVGSSGSSDATELACLVEELGGKVESSVFDLEAVLKDEDAADILASIGDRRYRERLYRRLREVRGDDWSAQYRSAFFAETDLRIMNQLYEALRDHGPERMAPRLIVESVVTPRKAPRAFVWVTRNVLLREELTARANHALLSKIIDALDQPEFKELKAPLREQFEEGGVAFAVFEKSDRDGVDHLLNLIDSASSLEEHRKTEIRRAIFRKYPDIRKRTDDDAIFATAEAIESKRVEFEGLVKREIPENAEAIRIAREYGDLRENFEYHAARQKHEVLNARAARLHEDLKRARPIDPALVTGGKVSIGARFELEPVGSGEARLVTILGAWDSDPSQGIFSYLSDFGSDLLGMHEGDVTTLEEGDYRVANVRPWRTPEGTPSEVEPSES